MYYRNGDLIKGNRMWKKLRLFFLFFFFTVQAEPQIPLFCFEDELNLLLGDLQKFQTFLQTVQKDKKRLQNLEGKKSELFWHLYDPIIGMLSNQKLERPLSWHFSLWDLSPKQGAFCSLAIVDSRAQLDNCCVKYLCKTCINMFEIQKSFPGYILVEKNKNVALCGRCKNEIFLYFLKNICTCHGMLTRNIIRQFAPKANITTYNIFDDLGNSSNKKLLDSLDEISQDSFDIVHLGCKIESRNFSLKDRERLDDVLKKMNYIIASSGNDGLLQKEEAYPAKNRHVSFDVGAFYRDQLNQYYICPQSQFEVNIGPKIVAPGLDILCPFTSNDFLLGYGLISGTSASAAIISGMLALVVCEFKKDFSYKQILTVLYACAKKLDSSWQDQVILGALDIRSALFCLHVLREIKKFLPAKKFLKMYETLISEILTINDLPVYIHAQKNLNICHILKIIFEKGDLKKTAYHTAKIVLMIYHGATKNMHLKKLFDKELVYLLRTIKSEVLLLQTSSLKHERIQFALNRK